MNIKPNSEPNQPMTPLEGYQMNTTASDFMTDLEVDIYLSCVNLARDINEELMSIDEMLDIALFDIHLEYADD